MESTITAKQDISISKIATSSSNIFDKYQLISPRYWFGTPNELSLAKLVPFEIVSTLIFIGVLILIAYKLLNSKLTPPEHKFLKRVIWLTFFLGPVGWVLILARNIGIVFFSARFLWVVWFGFLLGIGYYLFRYYRFDLEKSKRTFASYQLKKRYFPIKKKKR